MSKYLSGQFAAKVILVACCLALVDKRSDALFLGNIIGCNSFGCRIAALEQDVGVLKQQVMRLSAGNPAGMMNGYQQPNQLPYNQNQMMNQQGMNPNQQFNQQQQQQNGQQGNQPQQPTTNPTTRQTNYLNMPGQYPDELRRVQAGYQNPLAGQFMSA